MDVSNGAISFLAASENRVAVLVAIRDGDGTRRAVFDAVDASRRTVKRTLDDFEERGWIGAANATGPYRLSALGELVLDAYLDVAERSATADRLEPFLARVPTAVFDLDPMTLADADVVVRGESKPFAPMDRVLAERRGAREIREVVDTVQAESAAQLGRRVGDGEARATVVLHADVVEAVRANDEYAEAFASARSLDEATFAVTEREIPFVVGVYDDTAVLGVNDDAGVPEAVVVSDDSRVREWARERVSAYLADAEALAPAAD